MHLFRVKRLGPFPSPLAQAAFLTKGNKLFLGQRQQLTLIWLPKLRRKPLPKFGARTSPFQVPNYLLKFFGTSSRFENKFLSCGFMFSSILAQLCHCCGDDGRCRGHHRRHCYPSFSQGISYSVFTELIFNARRRYIFETKYLYQIYQTFRFCHFYVGNSGK